MRYSHYLHRSNHLKSPKIQRRQRLTSIVILVLVVMSFVLFFRPKGIDWPTYYKFFAISSFRILVAYLMAAIIAVFLAFLTLKNRFIEGLLLPVLDVAQSFPSFALLPFLIVIFGANGLVVIVILTINIVWPILFTLIGSLKSSRDDLDNAATLFGAKGWRKLVYFRLPSIFPAFISGSIIGAGEAWDVIVGAEIIAQVGGIGALLGKIGESGNLLQLSMAVSVYLLLIFLLNQIIWIPLLNYSTRYQNES
ncbi:MAG: ABC transporter permease subunit [Candidatus Saccharibacteria bacterium]